MPGMAQALDRWWADYAEHHQSAGNQWCHGVGIPLIAAGALGLLARVELGQAFGQPLELAAALIVLLAPVYLWLDARLGAALLAGYALLYLGARLLPGPVNLGMFGLGWIFQFVGHGVYEKRSPAFFRNLAHLLVGPLWVVNYALRVRPRAAPSHVAPRM
jgi:uncharacterized membrane protein YGL010W